MRKLLHSLGQKGLGVYWSDGSLESQGVKLVLVRSLWLILPVPTDCKFRLLRALLGQIGSFDRDDFVPWPDRVLINRMGAGSSALLPLTYLRPSASIDLSFHPNLKFHAHTLLGGSGLMAEERVYWGFG